MPGINDKNMGPYVTLQRRLGHGRSTWGWWTILVVGLWGYGNPLKDAEMQFTIVYFGIVFHFSIFFWVAIQTMR